MSKWTNRWRKMRIRGGSMICFWSGRVLKSYYFGCTTDSRYVLEPNGLPMTCHGDSILCSHSASTKSTLAMSTSSRPHLTTGKIQKTRAKFQQFRILVIGRANAGKTTILRKVCNTTGDPTIFDPNGKKVIYMMKVQTFMSDTDILACNLRSSRPPSIHPGK